MSGNDTKPSPPPVLPRADRHSPALTTAPARVITARYAYHGADDQLRYWTLRYQPEHTLPLRPTRNPAELECLHTECGIPHQGTHQVAGHVEAVPYRLPELRGDSKRVLFVVEREWDADRLRDAHGLPATSAAGWCGWTTSQARMIPKTRAPVILATAGSDEQRVTAAGSALRVAGFDPHIVRLADAPAGIAAWLDAGHSADELMDMAKASPSWTAPVVVPGTIPHDPAHASGNGNGHNGNGSSGHGSSGSDGHGGPGTEHFGPFTDTRNARRFVARFGETALFDFTRGHWRLYHDGVWRLDETKESLRLAKEVVAALPEDIDPDLPEGARRKLLETALACESTGRLEALLSNATAELGCTHERFDTDPWLLNVRNGTLDLRTGELLEHRPERFQSKMAPVTWDPHADCPQWLAFLDRVFNHDPLLIEFVRRAVGMSLVGEVLNQVIFVLWGTGANGKSTFLGVLQSILGGYARSADPYLLIQQDRPSHPTSIAELQGVRFLVTVETGHNAPLNEALVKQLTGGDVRWARYMFRDAFTYVPSDTPWLATNHKPRITGNSEGIWRRIKPVPFTVQIPRAEQQLDLKERLVDTEAAGILRWAVAGCLAWHERQGGGLGQPPAVSAASREWRSESDTLRAFLEDECLKAPASCWTLASEVYDRYVDWCKRSGQSKWWAPQTFGTRLSERGFTRGRAGHESARTWHGLLLRGGPPGGPAGGLPFDWSDEGSEGSEGSEADAAPQDSYKGRPHTGASETHLEYKSTTPECDADSADSPNPVKAQASQQSDVQRSGDSRARAREEYGDESRQSRQPQPPAGMDAAATPQAGTYASPAEELAAVRAAYADETGRPTVSDRAYWRGAVFDRPAFDAALQTWNEAKAGIWRRLCALEDATAEEGRP